MMLFNFGYMLIKIISYRIKKIFFRRIFNDCQRWRDHTLKCLKNEKSPFHDVWRLKKVQFYKQHFESCVFSEGWIIIYFLPIFHLKATYNFNITYFVSWTESMFILTTSKTLYMEILTPNICSLLSPIFPWKHFQFCLVAFIVHRSMTYLIYVSE